MRWNCPHCEAKSKIEDSELGEGWNFAKCYSCDRFSMINRNEQRAIRLTGAPPAPMDLPKLSAIQWQRPELAEKLPELVVSKIRRENVSIDSDLAQEPQKQQKHGFTRVLLGAITACAIYILVVWITTPVPVSQEVAPTVVAAQPMTDSITSGAMAPERPVHSNSGLQVVALSARAQLRAGPGLQFPVVATVAPEQTYEVADWSERAQV